ncbi:TonB-dependent receptor plug domain-containing protein [Zoogloea dura]|uniref:TonB-dependent receptor n=1 Tax=Zoogloea dura TaxID=2728840 RepID=A0A848G9E8_9RHOO|nr:TonB-dependent receptor [Zoogloea dura]NML28079.1 TonB-dependent receptor [Zoogloea dura]
MKNRVQASLLVSLVLGCSAAQGGEAPLVDLTLEELARLDVATVSRKAQKLSDTPAAVTVLSAEEIRRSGARSVPEALRDVPGVTVSQIGSGRWAVGVRGTDGRFSNKLLVQIDGRSVYSPLFSGVFWEALDVMLEDVERIEVIRGAGASLWGANAVNGVINIVTRKATATQGGLVSAGIDDQGQPTLAARQGIDLGDAGAGRVFIKGSELSRSRTANGREDSDSNRGWSGGFRLDGAGSGADAWSVMGNAYHRNSRENIVSSSVAGFQGLYPIDFEFEGSSLQGRRNWGWLGGEASLQAYVDHQFANVGSYGRGTVDTVDADFQHRLAAEGAHELMWGLGARYVRTEIIAVTSILGLDPARRHSRVLSAFVQDEITLVPKTWKLTVGGRFEYSSLSRFEPQPTVRLMWTPSMDDSLWTSWSRAARTPSIGESDATILYGFRAAPPQAPFPAVATISSPWPDWNRRAERLDAFEFGYRRNLGRASLEAVAFYNDYRRLIGTHMDPNGLVFPGLPIPIPPYYAPSQSLYRGNFGAARSHGLELGLDLPVTSSLRLQASYTVMDTRAKSSSDPALEAYGRSIETTSPHHWASLRAMMNAGRGHEFDLVLRRIGAIGEASVPAYTTVDLRYGWRVGPLFDLSLGIQNLFDPLHLEYVSNFFPGQPAYQPRRGYLQGVWRY